MLEITNIMKNLYRPLHTFSRNYSAYSKENYKDIRDIITKKITNAATYSIVGALVDGETRTYQGKSYKEVAETVSTAVRSSMDKPIYLPADAEGTHSSFDIFRRMGLETYHTTRFLIQLGKEGEPFDQNLVEEAIRHSRITSHYPRFQQGIDQFNKERSGNRAYDIRRMLDNQIRLESQGHHMAAGDEVDLDPNDRRLDDFMRRIGTNGTEKTIAKDLFDRDTFKVGNRPSDVIEYTIGTWAGALATGMHTILMKGSADKKFIGRGEAPLWIMGRLAVADVAKQRFWLPTSLQGTHTYKSIVDGYTALVMQASHGLVAPLSTQVLNNHSQWYFNTLDEGRKSIATSLTNVYRKSISLQEQHASKVSSKVPAVTWREEVGGVFAQRGGGMAK